MNGRAAERLHIRPFEPADEDMVVRLWQECGLVVSWNDPNEDIARKCRAAPELFLVGAADGQIIATVMAGYEGHRGWINYLAVAPGHRREGIGRRMMQAAEDELRALGCPKVNLLVRSSNRTVQEFYRSLGYGDEDVICMGKRLASQPPNAG